MFHVRRLPSIFLWFFFMLGYIMLGSSKLENPDDTHRAPRSEASERMKGGNSRGMHFVDAALDQLSSGEEGHVVVDKPRNLQPPAKRTKRYQNMVSQDSIAFAGLRGEFTKLSEGIHAGDPHGGAQRPTSGKLLAASPYATFSTGIPHKAQREGETNRLQIRIVCKSELRCQRGTNRFATQN